MYYSLGRTFKFNFPIEIAATKSLFVVSTECCENIIVAYRRRSIFFGSMETLPLPCSCPTLDPERLGPDKPACVRSAKRLGAAGGTLREDSRADSWHSTLKSNDRSELCGMKHANSDCHLHQRTLTEAYATNGPLGFQGGGCLGFGIYGARGARSRGAVGQFTLDVS